jgi:hypothetical protein
MLLYGDSYLSTPTMNRTIAIEYQISAGMAIEK